MAWASSGSQLSVQHMTSRTQSCSKCDVWQSERSLPLSDQNANVNAEVVLLQPSLRGFLKAFAFDFIWFFFNFPEFHFQTKPMFRLPKEGFAGLLCCALIMTEGWWYLKESNIYTAWGNESTGFPYWLCKAAITKISIANMRLWSTQAAYCSIPRNECTWKVNETDPCWVSLLAGL